jgi:hypothetical protein
MRNRRLFTTLFVFLLSMWQLGLSQILSASHEAGTSTPTAASRHSDSANPYNTAFNYVITFYPRWFTYLQAAHPNKLIGPVRISPIYHAVVAINVDTLYASAFFSLTNEPVIVTVPSTSDVYSVLMLDEYGNAVPGITAAQPGGSGAVYALIGPNWSGGTLPDGAIPINPGVNNGAIIFRADKYKQNGNEYEDMRQEAKTFRRNLCLIPLSKYEPCPHAGRAKILPEVVFAVPYKGLAVALIAKRPILFLKTLQTAVLSETTQPLTEDEQTLSDNFNAFFSDRSNWPQMAAATKAAHADIDHNYLTTTWKDTNWVHFTDIAEWVQPSQYLDRSSVTDYIQYGNNISAASYYQAFVDGNGIPLDGRAHNFVLTFRQGRQPLVTRFWSVTAYLPVSIELVPNAANKYAVASYTPGLVTGEHGSVSIVMAVEKPAGVPKANWLPIPKGPFNVLLRAYGPLNANTYVPPPIRVLP